MHEFLRKIDQFYKIVPIVPNAKDDEIAENDEKV
jgi:hypothetical protein